MVYCSKCGAKNEDNAEFCKKCGASLTRIKTKHQGEWDKRCEEDCAGGHKGWSIFWGLVVILIGLWIIFEIVLKNLAEDIDSLAWVNTISFPFWWIIFAIIGILIIITGIRIITKTK